MEKEIFCLNTLFPTDNVREITHPLLAYKAAISDPDTMYLHQVYKQQDWPQFQAAMQKEMEDQMANDNYSIILRSEIPQGHKVLPAIWSMKQKRDLRTGEVESWKARLNLDGSKMRKGIHYDETYSPVAAWSTIRLVLALVSIFNWHTIKIDNV